jgi:hypothetical protein
MLNRGSSRRSIWYPRMKLMTARGGLEGCWRCGRLEVASDGGGLNLQAQHDLDIEADRLGDRLDREVTAHAS